jgi:hypothetical protein
MRRAYIIRHLPELRWTRSALISGYGTSRRTCPTEHRCNSAAGREAQMRHWSSTYIVCIAYGATERKSEDAWMHGHVSTIYPSMGRKGTGRRIACRIGHIQKPPPTATVGTSKKTLTLFTPTYTAAILRRSPGAHHLPMHYSVDAARVGMASSSDDVLLRSCCRRVLTAPHFAPTRGHSMVIVASCLASRCDNIGRRSQSQSHLLITSDFCLATPAANFTPRGECASARFRPKASIYPSCGSLRRIAARKTALF